MPKYRAVRDIGPGYETKVSSPDTTSGLHPGSQMSQENLYRACDMPDSFRAELISDLVRKCSIVRRQMIQAGYRPAGAIIAAICTIVLSLFPSNAAEEKESACQSDHKADRSSTPLPNQVTSAPAAVTVKQKSDLKQEASGAKKEFNNGKASAADFVAVAWASYKAGRLDDALGECTIAISLNPHSSAAYDTRGHAEFDKKQFDKAVADFSKAISIDSSLSSTHYYRAQAYRALGKPELAEEDEAKAKELGFTIPKLSSPH